MTVRSDRWPGGHDRRRLAHDLRRLGLPRARVLLVHSSLRRIRPARHPAIAATRGPAAAAATLLSALTDAVGPDTTIVVPVHTTNNSITSRVFRRATAGLDAAQVEAAEASIEGFDPRYTPAYGMGAFAEYLRRQPGAVRSSHPQVSFAALGPQAAELMAVHDLHCHLGDRSPIGALDAADADILLVGTGYSACTALHLAEYRLPGDPPTKSYRCYTKRHGTRKRLDFEAVDLNDRDFPMIGSALDGQHFVRSGPVGDAWARVLPLPAAVNFAIGWMTENRVP